MARVSHCFALRLVARYDVHGREDPAWMFLPYAYSGND